MNAANDLRRIRAVKSLPKPVAPLTMDALGDLMRPLNGRKPVMILSVPARVKAGNEKRWARKKIEQMARG